MAGWLTNGVALASVENGNLPLPAATLLPAEYPQAGGSPPIDFTVTPAMLAASANIAQAITYGATTAFDASTGNYFTMTFGAGNTTLTFSNFGPGQLILGKITQDGVGSRTITVGNAGALTSGTPLSTAASSVDLVAFFNAGTLATPVVLYYPVAKAFA